MVTCDDVTAEIAGIEARFEQPENCAVIEWAPVTFAKVKVGEGGCGTPSTMSDEMLNPGSGVTVKVRLSPYGTVTVPGEIVPFAPCVTVIVYD